MRLADPVQELAIDEYLDLEKAGSLRHEYAAGRLYAMAGGSDEHNRIVLNIAARLLSATRGGPCRVYACDMKVRVDDLFYYPDVLVTCDPLDAERYFKKQPSVIFEVLSQSTEAIDRGEKLYNYRRLDSLDAYVLVSQDEPRIEVYRRQAEASGWRYDVLDGRAATVTLDRPAITLALGDIYEGI